MKQTATDRMFSRRKLLGGLALLVCTQPAWAIFGVWRRAARRTVIVAGAATTAAVATESAAASQEAAAAASAQAAANASAAAAQQAAAAADQAAARASQTRTPQQRLQELQSLYDQGLISASDYESAKAKIVNQIAQ
ncbi:MAG: SHOCT domain-containing protein [Candidatus Accumulibacter sp.]|uniref:SHOCT domain-containing protein n=1 Tax=Accumulibacter sp. TaxID=2053492 RepID=UPI0019DB76DC|nr:SHOCT domain-containing protein [Accumulibacter sp.]MBE2259813.1 SHOCT domain-containing protein [Paracoccaceae bacterium]MCB1943004.1 SHOCT domain-containing protein [Accumulibacter sp.]MCP5247965.1 SHOCT domain-containing protein [Accumulibacter sp.]